MQDFFYGSPFKLQLFKSTESSVIYVPINIKISNEKWNICTF